MAFIFSIRLIKLAHNIIYIMMLYYRASPLSSRTHLLRRFPQGGVVAEIGVHRGDFAHQILQIVKPDRLILIDPWVGEALVNGLDIDSGPVLYNFVLNRFSQEIRSGQVRIVRKRCHDACATFLPIFNWIYLDTFHLYPETLYELRSCSRVLRPDGFLCGHDYDIPRVRQAVEEFCGESGWKLLCVTADQSSSFVLTGPHTPDQIMKQIWPFG